MRFYKVKHLGAGLWPKDAVVNEKEIKDGGFDLDAWLRDGAVEETQVPPQPAQKPAAAVVQRPANPAPQGGVPHAAAVAGGQHESPIARAAQPSPAGNVQ